jgi:hypothetical protein
MNKLKSLINNQWFFPALILYYGLFYIAFGEIFPWKISVDGMVYSSFITDFTKSIFFDSYYVQRILPSLIVRVFFKIFSINMSTPNIVTAFQILNVVSIMLSCYFLKQIFILFKITLKNQMLAFALFLFNFGIIKFPFYMPVLTDTFAMMLSTALLYYYLKNNIPGLVISTLFLAFTWPMAYYQGLLLIAFPITALTNNPPLKWQKIAIYGTSSLYILVLCIIFVFIEKLDSTVAHVIRIDRDLLPLSLLGVTLFYFFISKLFFNKTLLDIPLFLKKINYKRLLISFCAFANVYIIIYLLKPNPVSLYSITRILYAPIISGLIKPLIFIVADASYFGIIVCLLFLFWTSFCKTVSQLGWGLVAAFALNLFLFGIVIETRCLINLLPWLIIFLIKAVNKYSFSKSFYFVVGLMCVFASKIWLLLNNNEGYPPMHLDKNGSSGFPDQKLWLNIGPWMNQLMYYVQGGVMLIFIGILFFMLYKIEFNKSSKIKLIRKY